MKKLGSILACLKSKIKKYFFKESKTDLNQECEKLFDMNESTGSLDEMKLVNEYIENYRVTTRWQTL